MPTASGVGSRTAPPPSVAPARAGAGSGAAEADFASGTGTGAGANRSGGAGAKRVPFVVAINQIARPFYMAALPAQQRQNAPQQPTAFTVSYRELFERMRALYKHLVRSVVRCGARSPLLSS